MDSDHSNSSTALMVVEEDQSFFDCLPFENPLAALPPLLCSDLEADHALVPLPSSFEDHFDGLSDLSPFFDVAHHDYLPLDDIEASFEDVAYVIEDVVPLNTIDAEQGNARSIERRISYKSGRSRLHEIGLEEMKGYFYMPITRAAKEMDVGVTLLKKRCRELGIPRWPHRKMKSLNTLIHNVQELGRGLDEECIRRELESLEEHRRLMEENPDLQLTERTKKLRQACFKANYKRRRAMRQPY